MTHPSIRFGVALSASSGHSILGPSFQGPNLFSRELSSRVIGVLTLFFQCSRHLPANKKIQRPFGRGAVAAW